MQLDCRNLNCPEPLLRAKKALSELKIGESLEILVNDVAPRENIKRFLAKNGFEAIKKLNEAGAEILSCGSCLEGYKLVDKLAIGEISNAYEIMDVLSKYEVIKL